MSAKSPTTKRHGVSALPFVLVNFAMSADGKTAFADGSFVPFTSERDQQHMLELRATVDAVMSGARTVANGDVTLGTGGQKYRRARLRRKLRPENLRIIVSGSGSIDPNAAIFRKGKGHVIVLTTRKAKAKKLKSLHTRADEVKICGNSQIDFRYALKWLRQKWNVKRLLCEGGGKLNGALIREGLVDELHLTVSPKIFGGRAASTIADGPGFEKLADAAQFKLKSMKRFGDELFLVYRAAKKQRIIRARRNARKAKANPRGG